MKPFKDKIADIDSRPEYPTLPLSAETVVIDSHRQGIEVTLTHYFLRTTLPYVSSKGIEGGEIGKPINHDLDYVNFGQGINLKEYSPYEEKKETKSAAEVLESNIIQAEDDPFFGQEARDGEIDIFDDSGKRSLTSRPAKFNARGVKGLFINLQDNTKVDSYNERIFYDAADQFLGIAVEGYAGFEESFDPFKGTNLYNTFGIEIDYTYIGPNEKVAARGYDHYGSPAGTDSIAFGGFLR